MSQPAPRAFRPKIHFTAPSMWLNDPNGLCYENGKYHLYYQHYPDDTVWGPMHWGHAVSGDLLHWEHCPIAMYPDELGMIFSGSAVIDEENVSGFGTDGKTPMVIFYTSHGDKERQSMAYSLDGGMTFTRYPGNPILENPGINDYRDPKVFRNPVKGGFSMVVSAFDRAMIYHSTDLKHWEKTGEFGPVAEFAGERYLWECPDLFPLKTETGEKWVFLLSVVYPENIGIHRTCYFIGQFDGDTFIREPGAPMELLDGGPDFYAGSTYWGTPQRLFIAWEAAPSYAGALPTGEYCGQMTLARTLTLKSTPAGDKVASKPVGIEKALDGADLGGETLPGECFVLRVCGEGEGSVTLYNQEGEQVVFGVDSSNHFYVDRSRSTVLSISETYERQVNQYVSLPRFEQGAWQIDGVFDISSLELFADQETRCLTNLLFPKQPYTSCKTQGNVQVFFGDLSE